jgi:subtilisin family serine protease
LSSTKLLGLVVLTIILVSTIGVSSALAAEVTISKLHPLLASYITGRTDPRLHASSDAVYVFVALTKGYGMSTLNGLLSGGYPLGQASSPLLVYGEVSRSSLLSLGATRGVSHVFPDVRIGFDNMKPDQEVYSEKLATDMYRVREIVGADRVNQLGVTGKGVTIAIVDTGTDFTIPDLQQAVARNSLGQAVSFDPDGQGFVITNLVVHREGDILKTSGLSVDIWNAAGYTDTSMAGQTVESAKISYDYGAPTVVSKSGNYHFGILREAIQDVISGLTVTVDFPIVVVDSVAPNVYDTVVVDISTAYFNFLRAYRQRLNLLGTDSMNLGLEWPAPRASWNDHSFTDEKPHQVGGTDLVAFDANGDTVPDFSAGLLAFGIDLSGRTGRYFSLLPPIDKEGNFINIFFDFESHGSNTAANAASRGVLKRDIYRNGTLIMLPGIAPEAKVMGVKALWLGEVTFGWYYASGFDWNTEEFTFKYTGNHRADIISNSWGDSNSIWDLGSTFGADYMSQLADAFSLPRFLDPAYPGTIMVIAAGNGGFGYGTTTSPAASTLAITVGASTSYAYRAQPAMSVKNEVAGTYDEVVPWSGRGPTSLGEPKPDVVDVGAFGFTSQYTFSGYGNGTKAYDVFGGTSMATPVTAGALALLIQEYRDTHGGQTPRPDLAKSILASTAHNLDYDQFAQGSGRVDVYSAVAAASEGRDQKLAGRFYLQSTSTWASSSALIESSWTLNMQRELPDQPMGSANWFAGVVRPGKTASTTFDLSHATAPTAQSIMFQLIGSKDYRNSTSGSVSWLTMAKDVVPPGTDMMKVTLLYRFSDFANSSTYDINNLLYAQLYNVERDGSLQRISNGAPSSTTSELVVSRPLDKFTGTPKVRILFQGSGSAKSVPFDISVRFYQKASWNWITTLAIKGNKLNASITVPTSTAPGVYGGFIRVADGNSESLVPVSVMVPIVASGQYGAALNLPYDNYAVYGAFDWSARYESGDWRTFAVIVPSGVSDIYVSIMWSDIDTDIQVHLTAPTGYLIASSEYPTTLNLGSGKFAWSTATGGPEEGIAAGGMQPGTYLLVLHDTLYGANSFNYRETFTLDITYL